MWIILLSDRLGAGHKAGMNYIAIALVGLGSGVISGLFGVGGGIVMVPAMHFLLKMDFKMAVGTSLAIIIPTAMMGATQHYSMGNINWKAALVIAPLAIVGSWAGAKMTGGLQPEHLKRAFGGFMVCVGLYMVLFQK
jgi:uncharacterized membrane protein YfcA